MVFNIFFSIHAGLEMDVPLQGILFLGIIPALILLFFGLKRYEGYYKDKGVFLSFVIGIILGFIASLVRIQLGPIPLLIVFIILLAFFEQLIKTIVLNIGRLQEKIATPIYGLSLGLGFGTVFTPFLIIAATTSADVDIVVVSLITIGTIGIILFHGATGAYIGYGIFEGKLIKYLFIAIVLQLPFNVILDLTRYLEDEYYAYYQIGLVIYGGLIFWYVLTKIIPKLLKQGEKRKRTKS
jgi:hypothetical protein